MNRNDSGIPNIKLRKENFGVSRCEFDKSYQWKKYDTKHFDAEYNLLIKRHQL